MFDWSLLGLLATVCILSLSLWIAWSFFRRTGAKRSMSHKASTLAPLFGRAISEMSFEDALNAERASAVIKDRMLIEVNEALGPTAKGFVVGLEVMKAAEARDLILAKFPEGTAKMLKKGSAVQVATKSGEKLLIAVDKNGRKIISQAKQVDSSLVSNLSQAANLIFGTAHIIAGYDNARRLKSIEVKLDRLVHDLKNQRASKLATTYETLKFLLASEKDLSNAKSELRICRKIFEILEIFGLVI